MHRLCSRDCASSVIGATLSRAKRWNDYDRSDKKGLALFPPPPVRMLVLTLTLLKLLAHGQCLPFTPNQMVAILKYALVYGKSCTAIVLPRILVSSGISLCVYEPTHYQSGSSRLSKQHVNVVLTLETIQ